MFFSLFVFFILLETSEGLTLERRGLIDESQNCTWGLLLSKCTQLLLSLVLLVATGGVAARPVLSGMRSSTQYTRDYFLYPTRAYLRPRCTAPVTLPELLPSRS